MNSLTYLYLLPFAGAVYLVVHTVSEKWKAEHRLIQVYALCRKKAGSYFKKTVDFIFPQKSRVRTFYERHFLKHAPIRFEKMMAIKLLLFVCVFLLIILIKVANIQLQTDEVFDKAKYRVDMLMQQDIKDQAALLSDERQYLMEAIKRVGHNVISLPKENVQSILKSIIDSYPATETALKDTLASRVYNRLYDYYTIRHYPLLRYLVWSFLLTFMPELIFIFLNILRKSETRRELRFLKKLIILNGSIKPVDFMEVLKILIDRSKYYKSILLDIDDRNKRNSTDTSMAYQGLYASSKSMNEKLFFEKLDEANNYDFDQAVKNIAYEFNLEKRELERAVRKRIDVIHVVGVTGFLLIIFVMVIYLIQPWMVMYDLRQLGF